LACRPGSTGLRQWATARRAGVEPGWRSACVRRGRSLRARLLPPTHPQQRPDGHPRGAAARRRRRAQQLQPDGPLGNRRRTGEIVALRSQYAVGFRATFVATVAETKIDTTLITGVAVTDPDLRELHWVVRPQRLRLHRGMIVSPRSAEEFARQRMRYSLRGAV